MIVLYTASDSMMISFLRCVPGVGYTNLSSASSSLSNGRIWFMTKITRPRFGERVELKFGLEHPAKRGLSSSHLFSLDHSTSLIEPRICHWNFNLGTSWDRLSSYIGRNGTSLSFREALLSITTPWTDKGPDGTLVILLLGYLADLCSSSIMQLSNCKP